MWYALIAIVAILGWVVVRIVQRGTAGGPGHAWAELEAIVTSETYDLARTTADLGRELAEAGGRPPLALEEPHDPEDAELRAAQLTRRLRGG